MFFEKSAQQLSEEIHALLAKDLQAELRCSICCSTLKHPKVPSCNHSFCNDCIVSYFKRQSQMDCPLCRKNIKKRSCVDSENQNDLVQAYLQLARAFKRDWRDHSMKVPEELAFMESQAIVSTQMADSPMRDFHAQPLFVRPNITTRAKRKLPMSSLCNMNRPSKLSRLAEEEEPTNEPIPPKIMSKKSPLVNTPPEPNIAATSSVMPRRSPVVTEKPKPKKRDEGVQVSPSLQTRQSSQQSKASVNKDVQCNLPPELSTIDIFIQDMMAHRRERQPALQSNMDALFTLLPGVAALLMKDQTREPLRPQPKASSQAVKEAKPQPDFVEARFVPDEKRSSQAGTKTKSSILPFDRSVLYCPPTVSSPVVTQPSSDVVYCTPKSSILLFDRNVLYCPPSVDNDNATSSTQPVGRSTSTSRNWMNKRSSQKLPNNARYCPEPVVAPFNNNATEEDEALMETQPMMEFADTLVLPVDKKILSPRKANLNKEEVDEVEEAYDETNFIDIDVIDCVPGTPSTTTPCKAASPADGKENVEIDYFDADVTMHLVENPNDQFDGGNVGVEECVLLSDGDLVCQSEERRRENMVVSVSRLQSEADEDLLHEFRISFPSIQLVDDVTPDCTHLVMMNTKGRICSNRSLKYAFAVAYRCELLGRDWMVECLAQKKIVRTDAFTLQSGSSSSSQSSQGAAWQRSRAATRALFEGKQFMLPPRFSEHHLVSRTKLTELIVACGGTIQTKLWEMHPPNAYIIFSPDSKEVDVARRYEHDTKVPVVNADWVLDSVSEFRIHSSLDKYRVFSSQTTRK